MTGTYNMTHELYHELDSSTVRHIVSGQVGVVVDILPGKHTRLVVQTTPGQTEVWYLHSVEVI